MFPKNLLVGITGSRGRLASALAAHLRRKGAAVRAYSRVPDSGNRELSRLPKDLQTGMVNVVLHLAWSVVPAEAELDPYGQWRDDLPQLDRLLKAIADSNRHGQPPVHFVFFSSGSVYGEGNSGIRQFQEQHRRVPKGVYARAKAEAEDMILKHVPEGLQATILRVTNPYGFPQKEGRPQGVIPAFVHAASKKEAFTVWGDGTAIKDYLYIEDLCGAVEKVIQARLLGVFNLASGESVALGELLALIQTMLGVTVSVRQAPPAVWDVHHAHYSSRRLRDASGWVPNFSLHEGLLKYLHTWKFPAIPTA